MVFLVDLSWCVYKYYYTYRPEAFHVVIDDDEVYTGVAFGFCRLVMKLLSTIPGAQIIFCLDSWDKSKIDIYPEYKAGRPHDQDIQKEWNTMVDEVIGITSCAQGVMFVQSDGKEADDLMANFFFNLKSKDKRSMIYSGDDDMIQLVAEGCLVFDGFIKGGFKFKDEHYIKKKYQVPPEALLRYRALVGDSSDNIKGVVPRTSHQFLRDFAIEWQRTGNFQQTLHEWASIKPKYQERLKENQHILRRNLKLMSLVKYSKEKFQFKSKDMTKAKHSDIERFQLHAFKSFLDKRNLWSE